MRILSNLRVFHEERENDRHNEENHSRNEDVTECSVIWEGPENGLMIGVHTCDYADLIHGLKYTTDGWGKCCTDIPEDNIHSCGSTCFCIWG